MSPSLLCLLYSACLMLPAEEPAPKIQDLAWLAGTWETKGERSRTEEYWTAPTGESMLGMARTIASDRMVFFEYLRIEARPDGIYYIAHPKARAPGTEFKLTRYQKDEARFENPKHDYPKRIIYRRNADGTMTARIEGDNKAQEFSFRLMAKP